MPSKNKKNVANKRIAKTIASKRKKSTASTQDEQPKKIFITYLNDPDRKRSADLIRLVDAIAKRSDMNRSKYVTLLIVKDLVKRGVLRPRISSKG